MRAVIDRTMVFHTVKFHSRALTPPRQASLYRSRSGQGQALIHLAMQSAEVHFKMFMKFHAIMRHYW
ncbi:hypothetical protein [Microvirga makkahensis]|uniref:Uncharacterized protein n=1 Tax=Microvirga makkahensis TaxID=1128670 RepID=A0A7X3SQK6_9HYPH|nr:hypothetical protein [Microvirga makkahensis]MXQ13189.1 hypothetical protein [Microvirga makkahensis]